MFQPSAAARDDTAVPGASQSPQPPSGTGGSSASTDLSSTLTPDSPPSISRQSSSSSEDALGPSTATGARREKRERGAGTEKLMPKSCLGCRARKVRCPRNLVACERCIRRGDTCTYDAEVHRTAPPRSRGGEQRHKPARSTSSITTFASLKSLPLPTSPSPTGIDVASRVYAAFVKAIPALHHLVLCEYLLASFRTGPGAWTSTPSLATTLVWTLLDAALDSCSLHLPAFQPLEQKIAGYKDRLHMLDAAGSLAVVILCTIGARSSPQTELFDVACDFAGSDQSSTVEQVGARREAVCRALVDVATELGTATELVVGRDNLESLVSLSQLFVEEFELPRGRIATRMAWGMLSDVGGLEKGVLPAMGLVLFRNDSIIAATLQRSFIVHLSDLSEFASTQSLRLPDFAEDNFSSVLATLGAPGILSHEQLTRCTTFANGWTANCYRVFTKVSMSLDRQQGDSSDSAVAALEIRAVWRRIDFIHTLVQRLQQRVASSASSNPQNALGLQENALLFVRTDSRLIGLMFLLHKLLVRRSAWQGSRESGESSRELLVESYSRVRKSLKLLSFYAGLYLRSRDKHLLHHLIVELNLLPDWTLLASQRVGDADGPRATEDEMTDLELETLKRAVGVACFYTPLAVQRLSELIIGRNTMQNYSGASISPSQDDLADALPTDVLRQARSAISPATIAPFVDTQTHAMLDQGYFDPEASPSTSVYPFPNSTYAPEAPSELPSSFLPASLSTDASFSLPARARLDGSAEEDDDWMSVLLAAPWGGEVDSDLRLGVSPAEVVQDEVMQDWDWWAPT